MEKRKGKEFEKEEEGLFEYIAAAIALRRTSASVLLTDILCAAVAFLFVRRPLFFGAYPLSVALISLLPGRVVPALIGTLVGTFTLGDEGVIYAMAALIIFFLRLIISSSAKRSPGQLFGEGLLLRAANSVIGGFAVAVYEILLRGLNMSTVLFGLSMILTPPLLIFVLSGLFEYGGSVFRLVFSGAATLRSMRDGRALYFKGSALAFLFLISFSLGGYSALGISFDYLFASFVTLVSARSLGAVHGAAVGFVSALAVSGSLAGGFMLAGAVAGAVAGFGAVYSCVFGGVVLSAFSLYVGGVLGIAATLPEFAISAALSYPWVKKISAQGVASDDGEAERSALDMIGTMALSYKNTKRKGAGMLVPTVAALSGALHAFLTYEPTREELENVAISIVKTRVCDAEKDENIERMATKLYNKEVLTEKDFTYLFVGTDVAGELAEEINAAVSRIVTPNVPESSELALLSRIMREAAAREESELSMNEAATDALESRLSALGYSDFTVRVFGKRRHVILAGGDRDGAVITSAGLHRAICEALGAEISPPEYFRRGNMALMECDERAKLSPVYAAVGAVCDGSEVSGDVARKIETEDRFYALVSDGMGTGALARRSSELVSSYFSATLPICEPSDSVVHLLNSYLLGGREECSATLDLFEVNIFTGEAVFLKSGGAPSYIKRGSSIFRIRSNTAPLGIMSTIDTEKIRVQVEHGDFVIMTSDGVHGIPEDAPWLLELIGAINPKSSRELADAILAAAIKHKRREDDDLTVCVVGL